MRAFASGTSGSSSCSFLLPRAGRFRWTHDVTTTGSSTWPSSLVTWTPRTPDYGQLGSGTPPQALSGCPTGTRTPLEFVAFYFRDLDGHSLEILWFPEGKGDTKWHKADGHLFLGIDHTAIAVTDTDARLALYRDLLGMRVAGENENYGPEQERLNNVFGAHVRITAVRADSGPGIEFLEYLAPQDGCPYPADAKANDLFHWQTRIVDSDAEECPSRKPDRQGSRDTEQPWQGSGNWITEACGSLTGDSCLDWLAVVQVPYDSCSTVWDVRSDQVVCSETTAPPVASSTRGAERKTRAQQRE